MAKYDGFDVYDKDGNMLDSFDLSVGFLEIKGSILNGRDSMYYVYTEFTEEELANIANSEKMHQEQIRKSEERERFLEDAPARVSDNELALAELGVMAADNSITIEDLMLAVAELGAIVAGE